MGVVVDTLGQVVVTVETSADNDTDGRWRGVPSPVWFLLKNAAMSYKASPCRSASDRVSSSRSWVIALLIAFSNSVAAASWRLRVPCSSLSNVRPNINSHTGSNPGAASSSATASAQVRQ
ncbi:MAG: hypothetical protein IPP16_18550 [Acidimicrobiaceae bacterium]|nr:hypothetical protein [Acidimicrobiaceae bacterium]